MSLFAFGSGLLHFFSLVFLWAFVLCLCGLRIRWGFLVLLFAFDALGLGLLLGSCVLVFCGLRFLCASSF